jgi:hypothetical protein
MGDETLESGNPEVQEWDDVAQDAQTIMSKLLSPPSVPDTVWFSRATSALMQCDVRHLLLPSNQASSMLISCLRSGAFRSQSAILDFLRKSCCSVPMNGEKHQGQHAMNNEGDQGRGLIVMAEDEGLAVLHAALKLCREQPAVRDGADDGVERKRAAPERQRVFVQQNCCEDPFDCEEPAVRFTPTYSLRLLAARTIFFIALVSKVHIHVVSYVYCVPPNI